jgi:hypothetical protein
VISFARAGAVGFGQKNPVQIETAARLLAEMLPQEFSSLAGSIKFSISDPQRSVDSRIAAQ